MTTFAYSKAPLRSIKEVQFGILSPEEIVRFSYYSLAIGFGSLIDGFDRFQKAYSVAKIEFPEVMDESGLRQKMGGLMDPRMGTIDRNFKCQTCGESMSECPGHFGHIELARPVFHGGKGRSPRVVDSPCPTTGIIRMLTPSLPGFLVKVKKILECICVNCGRLKADLVS